MPILKNDLESLLKENFPHSEIVVKDLAGDNDHYQVEITCQSFCGLNRIQQHQKVYAALSGYDIHALSIKTSVPSN